MNSKIDFKKIKRAFKMAGMILLIVLACAGVGFGAALIPPMRRFKDKETHAIEMVEQVEKKVKLEDEEDDDER